LNGAAEDGDEFFEDKDGERVEILGVRTLTLEHHKNVIEEINNIPFLFKLVESSNSLQQYLCHRFSVLIVVQNPRRCVLLLLSQSEGGKELMRVKMKVRMKVRIP